MINVINRPTYGCGTQGDAIRNIVGNIQAPGSGLFGGASDVFYVKNIVNSQPQGTSAPGGSYYNVFFDPSLVVSTGPENSPREISTRYWRRVA